VAGFLAATALTVLPAHAQRGNSGNHVAGATSHGSGGGPSAQGGSSTTHGNSADAHGPASKSTDGATTNPTSTPSTTTGTSTVSGSTTSGSPTTGTTTKIDFTATPVGQKLSRNTALSSKVSTRLTAEGYTGSVYQAAYGFKNLGQFVAATNVSKNLGISFNQLKLQMTGVQVSKDGTVLKAMVGPDGKVVLVDPSKPIDPALSPAPTKSLGQSIQTLKPSADATAAANTGTKQADVEIAGTSTTSGTSTKTGTSTSR
jgi:hypothetical protein